MKLHVYHAGLTVCMMVSLLCLFERPAYAYIDPGSGILACQAISAFVAGTFYYWTVLSSPTESRLIRFEPQVG